MVKDSKPGQAGSDERRKAPWSTPTLVRIEASEAEISTRRGGDGAFTFS